MAAVRRPGGKYVRAEGAAFYTPGIHELKYCYCALRALCAEAYAIRHTYTYPPPPHAPHTGHATRHTHGAAYHTANKDALTQQPL
eukprot:scaffold12216_cov112-Isochrysis_galbana.AAC.2